MEIYDDGLKEIDKMKIGPEKIKRTLRVVKKTFKELNKLMNRNEKELLVKFLDGEIPRDKIKCDDEELTRLLKKHKLI